MSPKAPPVKREAVLPEPEGPASPLTAPKGTPEREGLQPAPKRKAPVLQGASGSGPWHYDGGSIGARGRR